ncbi:MAG: ExbD/TolR family protein [Chitinophagales bacterium]
MSDVDLKLTSNGKGRNRNKRKTPFLDLTPMVDLAFLLICFFMLTTAMSQPESIVLKMPETGDPMDVIDNRVITVIADKNNRIWYYMGSEAKNLEAPKDILELRSVLYENVQRVKNFGRKDYGLICLIKLTDDANYQQMIDILDEMVITDVYSYAIQDLTTEEKEQLQIHSPK